MKGDNNEQKANLSRMSKLLLSGATMLDKTCPDCNIPLFKKNDEIFCPQCERKAVYAKDETEIRQIEQNISLEGSYSQLRDILIGKMTFLSNQMASLDDPQSISQLLELIERIIELIQKIS